MQQWDGARGGGGGEGYSGHWTGASIRLNTKLIIYTVCLCAGSRQYKKTARKLYTKLNFPVTVTGMGQRLDRQRWLLP